MGIFDALVVAETIRQPAWRPNFALIDQIDDPTVSREIVDEWDFLVRTIEFLSEADYCVSDLKREQTERAAALTALYVPFCRAVPRSIQ